MPSRVSGRVKGWRAALAMVFVVAAGACRDPVSPNQVTVVNVPSSRTIVVANRTSTPIFAQVWGRAQLALILIDFCADPGRCESIAPGASRTYNYPEPFRGVAETEAAVQWWHSARGSDGRYRAVDVSGKVVPL